MKPSLTERGVRYWIKDTLSRSSTLKDESRYIWTNLYLFIGFLVIVGLFVSTRTRKSASVLKKEKEDQRAYIENLVSNYKRVSSDLITGLPLV